MSLNPEPVAPTAPGEAALARRRRRRRRVAARRLMLVGSGMLLVPAGLISMPTPVPIGLVLFATGLYFLATGSRRARRVIRGVRRAVPPLSRWLNRIEPRMPRPLRLVIRRSDPGV